MKSFTAEQRTVLFPVIIAILVLIEATTHFGYVEWDSLEYLTLSRYFLGEAPLADVTSYRIAARPFVPFLVAILSKITTAYIQVAYGVLNVTFWIAFGLAIYALSVQMIGDREASLYAAIFATTAFPMLVWGASVMTDSAALFFHACALYLAVRALREGWSARKALLAGALVSPGSLVMERVPFSISVFIVAYCLFVRREWKRGLAFLFPIAAVPVAWNFLTPKGSYLEYLIRGMPIYLTSYAVRGALSGLAIIYHVHRFAAPLAFIGFSLWKEREKVKIWWIALLSLLAVYAWHGWNARLAMVTFLATMPLAGLGLKLTIDILAEKPVTERIPKRVWIALILAVWLADTNLQAYEYMGFKVSLPWRMVSVWLDPVEA